MTRRSSGSPAHAELSRALAAHGPARVERLVSLSHDQPDFAPVWVALAEHHWSSGRSEEALQAARRALRLDASLHSEFSVGLSGASQSLLPAKSAAKSTAPPPDLSSRPLTGHVGDTARPMKRPAPSGPADKALQQASILVGYRRRERLEELSQEYPDHAPTLIALAEETLVQRSVEQAMQAAERAMQLDPSLEAMMSPPMARAWKYHKIERRIASTPSRASKESSDDPSSDPRVDSPAKPSSSPGARKPYQKAGASAPATPEARDPKKSTKSKPRLDKMLATALGLRSREERITILEQLISIDPDNSRVLFHLAKELSLAGRLEKARLHGDHLSKISSELYAELYEWASTHWANQQRSATKAASAEPPNAKPAAPTPKRQSARPKTPTAPLNDADEVEPTTTMARVRDFQLPESDAPVSAKRPPKRRSQPLLDDVDHSKENAEFKTQVMHLADVQRLADETRPLSDPAAGSTGERQKSPNPRPMVTEVDFSGPPRHIPNPRGQRYQSAEEALLNDRPGVRRSATADTHVQRHPPMPPRPQMTPPDTELQLIAPAGAGQARSSRSPGTEEAPDDSSSSMPSWLQNPTPWTSPQVKTKSDQPPSDQPPSDQPPSDQISHPKQPEHHRPQSQNIPQKKPAPQTPASRPRAHPRLVRRANQPPKGSGSPDEHS